MSKLKDGWLNIFIIAILIALSVSYLISSYFYKLSVGVEMQLLDALLQPTNIYNYIMSDENLKLIVPFLPVLILAGVLYLLRKNLFDLEYKDASKYGLYGTAKFANPEKMRDGKTLAHRKKSTYKKDLNYNLNELKNGYILGKIPNSNKLLIMDEQADVSNQNIAVIGSSGSAKSQAYVITNLVNVRDKSIIVTDPKGELFNMTAQLKKDQGYKIYQVDFISFMQSKYNPLSYVETTLQAQKVANTIITNFEGGGGGDNVFFKNSATNMLSALIIYVKAEFPEKDANMEQVVNTYTKYVQDEDTFNEWIKTIPEEHPAREMLNSIIDLTGNTRGSVTSTLNNGFNIFKLPQVKQMTRKSDFHFKDFVEEKSILYVKLSMEDDTFAPLTSVFFSQMINIYYDVASQSPDQKLKRKVVFMLDEFANIGKLDNYSRTLATCRSLGLSMHTILQNRAQLEKKSMYGREETNDILGNHDTIILLRAKQEDIDTTKWISDALGQTTKEVMEENISISKSGKTTSNNKKHVERPLMTPSEIGSLGKDQSIVIIAGQNPLFLNKAYQSDIYQDLLSKKVGNDFIANYNNKREELGFTTPLMDETNHEAIEEEKLSSYQKEIAVKKEMKKDDEDNAVLTELTTKLTEEDTEELNKKIVVKKEVNVPEDTKQMEEHVKQTMLGGTDDLEKMKSDNILYGLEN